MSNTQLLKNYCLHLGDNALILGHRLSELCSKGPFLEEDIALTNISLDMIGRAQAFLRYAAELGSKSETEDDLAYRRFENRYLNNLIAELPNGNFAVTIARQFYISAFEVLFFEELSKVSDTVIAGIAQKAVKEAKYHFEHAAGWVIRLGDGTELSHQRMQTALNDLWMYTGELFEMDETEIQLMAEGKAVDLIPLHTRWMKTIREALNEATLTLPTGYFMQSGGKKGVHTEHLGHILSEMQYLQRTYPDAKW